MKSKEPRDYSIRPSQRIIINTVATYARSVFAACLALFSVRWVLNALGESDFGLYSVIGGLIVFITFMNSVMAWSVSRFFAYSIGQGDSDEVNRWFNAALFIHLCLAIILIFVGWPIGEYFIAYVLYIPTDRISVCLWVFRVSLMSAFISMISVPFVAMFTAKQHITELAGWGILQSILIFFLAWYLSSAPGDHLLFYAIGTAAIIVFIFSAQTLRAIVVFNECHVVHSYWFDYYRLKKLFFFAVWNFVGNLGTTLRNQGSAIILNLYFGPKVNAAYGIANQIAAQTDQLAFSMIGAFSPEIIASEGCGNRVRMLMLSSRVNKFGTLMIMVFAIPLLVEMEYILRVWLQKPPVYTDLFCQLIICAMLIERLTTGYMIAVGAHGRIAGFQTTMCAIQIFTLPLALIFLKLGFAPPCVGIAFIVTTTGTSFVRVIWMRHLFGISVLAWLDSVVYRCCLVGIVATVAALTSRCIMLPSLLRLALTIGISIAASLITAWFFVFDNDEREFVRQRILRLIGK